MATLEGLASLNRKLARMGPAARKHIRQALVKSAVEINSGQVALAARSRRTGELISEIGYRDGEHELQIVLFSSALYSAFVEFGTVHSQAEPFFFPPYRLLRKKTRSRISRSVSQAAREAAHG